MKAIILSCALALLGACNSTTTELTYTQPAAGTSDAKLFVCSPKWRATRYPALYVNGAKVGTPEKGKRVTAAVAVGDKWDIIYKNWGFEDLEISEGMISSKGNTYLILTWHIDFSGLNQLGLGEISAQATALLSATTKALNEKNSFTGPFKVTAVTEAQYNKQCEQT
jgi:hypothetical protein